MAEQIAAPLMAPLRTQPGFQQTQSDVSLRNTRAYNVKRSVQHLGLSNGLRVAHVIT